MGVIEALACGIKVVVPAEVGLIPDLPKSPAIFKFEKGNYSCMKRAIGLALRTKVSPDDARYAVRSHTIKNWQDAHARAFEEMLQK